VTWLVCLLACMLAGCVLRQVTAAAGWHACNAYSSMAYGFRVPLLLFFPACLLACLVGVTAYYSSGRRVGLSSNTA
jgi:hypothetical protein